MRLQTNRQFHQRLACYTDGMGLEFVVEKREADITPRTVRELMLVEKDFLTCFHESIQPILLYLSEWVTEGQPPSPQSMKDYLQSQCLPLLPELRNTPVSEWIPLCYENKNTARKTWERPTTEEGELALSQAILERGIMSGRRVPGLSVQKDLPRFYPTHSLGREFTYRSEGGEAILQVPNPQPYTYRVNIPDQPGLLREVAVNRMIKMLWSHPNFREHGFQVKIIGHAQTDGVIFYFSDTTADEGIKMVLADAIEYGYGSGEPARFGQTIDARAPGITVTSEPRGNDGKSLGTFGSSISELLTTSLVSALDQKSISKETLLSQLLTLEEGDWTTDVLEPIFMDEARKMFGERLYTNNLAFIDKGLVVAGNGVA